MRKPLFWYLLIAACVAAYYGAAHWTVKVAAQSAISVKPFTLEFVTYNSAGKLVEDRITARRSDGSEVMVSMSPAGKNRRIDFMDGASMALLDAVKIRMSGIVAADRTAARKTMLTNPPTDCLFPGETLASRTTTGGVAVNVVKSTRGSYSLTEDRAPAYACKALDALGQDLQPDGTWVTRFQARLVAFTPGEPDARIFAPGDGYREMSPSQVRDEALRGQGVTKQSCPACFSQSAQDMDAEYNAAQGRKP